MKRIAFFMLMSFGVLAGCNTSINKSIYIQDGDRRSSGVNSVNGSVIIGDDCEVKGQCRSVNGAIRVGEGSKTRGLQAVNGSITVGARCRISGSLSSVNGPVRVGRDVEVRRNVTSVNGDISLTGVSVGGDAHTHNGDIELSAGTEVEGDIVIKRSKGSHRNTRRLVIRITDNAIVHGDVINRDRDLEVRVILSSGGRIQGETRDVEVERR